VVKALALGAHAVQIGRPTLYGIAAGGQPGAQRAIGIFRDEIDRVMALLGCRSVSELNTDYLHFASAAAFSAGHGKPGLRLLDSARAVAER